MKQAVKYFYAVNSNWLNFDATASFKPFVTTIILNQRLEKSIDQNIADEFKKEYGFNLPYFILTNIISSYINEGYAESIDKFLRFNLEKMQSLTHIENSSLSLFNTQYKQLINDFVNHCQSKDIDFYKAENILLDFIKEYDATLLNDRHNVFSEINDEMEVERFILIDFLKSIKENDYQNYELILKLCQGNIIKSYLLNEGLEKITFDDMRIYFDSPVIYRILGYYDKYYKDEYIYLLDLWRKQNVKFYIYSHNYDEICNLLENVSEELEEKTFTFNKKKDITLYFKSQGFTSLEVKSEIYSLPSKLKELGIEIVEIDYNNLPNEYLISQKDIEDNLLDIYMRSGKYTKEDIKSYSMKRMIEVDAKSVFASYALRANNSVKEFHKNNLFFVTRNTALIDVVKNFNNSNYPKTISPVIRDTLIGMIACSNDMQKLHGMVEKKFISMAYTAFKPTRKVLEQFSIKVDAMKNDNLITDEQYLILKHNNNVLPYLAKLKDDYVNYETIAELLAKLHEEIISPVRKEFEEKIDAIEKNKEKLAIENSQLNQKMIEITKESDEKSSKINDIENEVNEMYIKSEEELNLLFNKVNRKYNIIVRVVSLILTTIVIIAYCIVLFKNINDVAQIILLLWSIFQFIFSIFTFINQKFYEWKPVSYFVKKEKNKIYDSFMKKKSKKFKEFYDSRNETDFLNN